MPVESENERVGDGDRGKHFRQALFDAHLAVQTGQHDNALGQLARLKVEKLPVASQAGFYAIRGEANFRLNNYSEANQDLEKALKLYRHPESDVASPLQIAQLRNFLAATYYQTNRYEKALQLHRKCLQAVNEGYIKNNRFKLKLYNNLGNDYSFLGKLTKAVEFYTKGLEVPEEPEEEFSDRGNTHWGLGITYRQLEKYAEARTHLEKALELYLKAGNLHFIPSLRNTLGWILVSLKEYDGAEKELTTALEEAQKTTKNQAEQALSYLNLAYLYFEKSQAETTSVEINLKEEYLKLAEDFANQGLVLVHKIDERLTFGLLLAQLAEIKLAQGAPLSECMKFFNQAVEILEQTDERGMLSHIHRQFSAGLRKIGALEEAFEILETGYKFLLAQPDQA